MNNETRRLISALLAAMAVFFVYQYVYFSFFAPPPPSEPTPGVITEAEKDANSPLVRSSEMPEEATSPTDPNGGLSQTPTMSAVPRDPSQLRWVAGEDVDSFTFGDRSKNNLELELSPIGASIENLYLTERYKDERFMFSADGKREQPYQLLRPVKTDSGDVMAYNTHRLVLHRGDSTSYALDDLIWNRDQVLESEEVTSVTFWTELTQGGDGTPILRLKKSYRLPAASPFVYIVYEIENLTSEALSVTLEQDGPVGITREQAQYDMRTLIGAAWDGQTIQLETTEKRNALRKATVLAQTDGNPSTLGSVVTREGIFAWTASTNRFFGAFTRVVNEQTVHPDTIESARSFVVLPNLTNDGAAPGDMQVRLTTRPIEVPAGSASTRTFEIYAGAKDGARLEQISEVYANSGQLGYHLAEYADRYCMCTFQGLPWMMRAILHGLQTVVINYGIAIIILVVLIRTLLHRLTVFQQRSMFKTQDGMARIQPKMAEIKKKYPDDQNKQNQEMMRLFSEEGVNPAAGLVGMIPMFIQMPILVAMWMSINGDVDLRHASFVFWITDLSQPDEFIRFSDWGLENGLTIPLLGQLIPSMFANIPAFNLLPIVMGVGMYLQQKYMPKPGQKERQEARKKVAQETGEVSQFEQQMKQQETIAIMMSFMFPLMFYYMPAGLNLYWLATTVFGIGETLLIRRQLEKEKAEGKFEEKKKPGRQGPISRFFAHLAEQAEEFQKQADELSGKKNSGVPGKKADDKETPYKPSKKKGRK